MSMSESERSWERERVAGLITEIDRSHRENRRLTAELQAIWDAWDATPNEVRIRVPVALYNLLEMCSGRIRIVHDKGVAE